MGEIYKAFGVIGTSLRDTYNHLGTTVMVSVIWFLSFGLVTIIPLFFFIAESPLVKWSIVGAVDLIFLAPVTTAAFYVAKLILWDRADVGLRDFWAGLRRFWWRSLGVSALHVLITIVIAVDLAFCLTNPSSIIKLGAGFFAYALIFVAMMLNYYYSFLVHQDTTTLKALKKAALVVLGNPLFSIVISVFALILLAVSLAFAPAFMLAFMGAMAFLQNNALIELFKKYGIRRPDETDAESPDANEKA